MKSETILQADVLDIIFENRNKTYGAYALRKFYNNRLGIAMVSMLMMVAVLYSFTLIKKDKVKLPSIITDPYIIKPAPKPPVDKPLEPKPPKQTTVNKKLATSPAKPSQKFVNNVVITKDDKADKIANLVDSVAIDDKTNTVKGPTHVFVTPTDVKTGDGDVTITTKVDKVTPSSFAEVMPTYPGGNDALRKFLERNLKNPQDIEEGGSVFVKIRFVVGYDGALKSFETVQDGGAAFNEEVIRVLKKMPQWIPGKTKGENVSVYFTIPVKFSTTD
ncbi:energy transducer TonB [Ferruginibacter yonginensis]|uniref:Energy transducer TonB n=1 Tax=Ferruginibacter yonginensis TaxID=1310416 RepID=A0ABV8QRS2_9BACT